VFNKKQCATPVPPLEMETSLNKYFKFFSCFYKISESNCFLISTHRTLTYLGFMYKCKFIMNCHAFRPLMCLWKKPNLLWYGGQSMKDNFQLLSILQEQLGIFNNHIETKIMFSIARILASLC
jgi:hypothetical protein